MAKAIAIIPARGGSKRIPRKNIKPFRGKPIIQWSIETALQSELFDSVMVSTDDPEIAMVAKEAGASVPFMRSPETADDYATTPDVLLEVLQEYAAVGESFGHACCLYPTAPLVSADDLKEGYDLLRTSGFDVVMPVCAFSYPIWRSLDRNSDGGIRMNFPENLNARSQDLNPSYHDAGQYYWFKTEAFLKARHLLTDNTGSIIVPAAKVQDIDTTEDWAMAELKHERLFP